MNAKQRLPPRNRLSKSSSLSGPGGNYRTWDSPSHGNVLSRIEPLISTREDTVREGDNGKDFGSCSATRKKKRGMGTTPFNEDEHEKSMLNSIIGSSSTNGNHNPNRVERLHLHEYEDQSDAEDPSTSYSMQDFNELRQKSKRSLSAGVRGSFVREMESRLAGLRHEKLRTQRSGVSGDERVSGLLYDPDFDCYYNPIDDQYYKVKLSRRNS
ncbi:hypothetical protein Q1695_006170 [Nippostrongylus brasiliensis]|nr:hypothetical protein Q1695_006170 [Nippostrongylus brasiliensis]